MKKLTLYALLIMALTSCSKSKETIFDKCLEQANQTFSKEQIDAKKLVIKGCMFENEYTLDESCEATVFNSICYEKN